MIPKKLLACLIMGATAVLSQHAQPDEPSIQEFLGPHPGQTYVYRRSDGGTLKVVGLCSSAKNAVFVEADTKVPHIKLPRGARIDGTNRFTLLVRDNLLIETNFKTASILLQGPLVAKSSEWERTATSYSHSGKAVKVDSLCTITSVARRTVFKSNRFIVATQCKTKLPSWTMIETREYAQGIGLIETTWETFSKNSESSGVLKSSLIRIEKSPRRNCDK